MVIVWIGGILQHKRFKVILSKTTQKQLRKIDVRYKKRIFSIFEKLELEPFCKGDIQKIKGEINTFRFRVGDYRIIYEIHLESKKILIVGVFPRGGAYKKF